MPLPERRRVLDRLSTDEHVRFPYAWRDWWARDNQLPPPGTWSYWLLLAGRGFGKTRTGAEWVREQVKCGRKEIGLIASIAADIRDVLIEGPAGILTICGDDERPLYEPSKRHRLTFPNGAVARGYSADEPERLRGPSHDALWCDELSSWRYGPETWDMAMFGLRAGANPQVCITTTPKPIDLLIGNGKDGRRLGLLHDPGTVITRGSSYDNISNLAPEFISTIIRKYEGTRLGRQELMAEVLEDVPGALWTHTLIDQTRSANVPDLTRIVVAIDPAATSGEEADETGIIVAGKDERGHGWVLADGSGRMAPIEWARRAIGLYKQFAADRIVAEVNNGGEMVEATIRMVDLDCAYSGVRASRGKVIRAEPVAALYEQRRVHHVGGFAQLEDEMCSFTTDFDRKSAGYSPDRVDALVWALSELLVEPLPNEGIFELMRQQAAA